MKSDRFALFRPFKPDNSLVSMFHVIVAIVEIFFIAIFLLASYLSGVWEIFAVMAILLLFVLAFYFFWVGKYYQTIFFELKDDEVTWRRGVWFRMTGIVPYDRITNIDIYQGPLMRHFGFSSIKIQTAGYSGQAKSEIVLEGIVEAEELRETLRSLIREARRATGASDATGTSARPPVPSEGDRSLLEEVRAIRQILEKRT